MFAYVQIFFFVIWFILFMFLLLFSLFLAYLGINDSIGTILLLLPVLYIMLLSTLAYWAYSRPIVERSYAWYREYQDVWYRESIERTIDIAKEKLSGPYTQINDIEELIKIKTHKVDQLIEKLMATEQLSKETKKLIADYEETVLDIFDLKEEKEKRLKEETEKMLRPKLIARDLSINLVAGAIWSIMWLIAGLIIGHFIDPLKLAF